jgi:nicotinate-nucleotide adenylyltransferase
VSSSSPTRRIGILGGTFDPIHCGHLDVGDAASEALGLTQLHVVASHVPPHRPQPVASSLHRFAMVSLVVSQRAAWRASDLELRTAAPSYTSTTLRSFHERGFAPAELFFIVGADAFAEIAAWRDYPAILGSATFVVVSRPGSAVQQLRDRLTELAARMTDPSRPEPIAGEPAIVLIDRPTADVSSSAIRQRRAAGQSIAGLVPPLVQQHIERHGLYTSNTPGRRAADAAVRPQAGRLHGQD